jgi:hypothetical protein
MCLEPNACFCHDQNIAETVLILVLVTTSNYVFLAKHRLRTFPPREVPVLPVKIQILECSLSSF